MVKYRKISVINHVNKKKEITGISYLMQKKAVNKV